MGGLKVAIKTDMGETLSTVELTPTQFKTGSRGYRASFKVQNGARYQVSVNAVEIGSKPKAKAK